MKRTLFVFVGLFIVGFLLFSAIPFVRTVRFPELKLPQFWESYANPTPSLVSVTLDFGDRVATASSVSATTAFDALVAASAKEQLELKTKQYDFGAFVEQIGGVVNTKEKSWIYFVNGKSGTVAADKQPIIAGDSVEWRYIEPTIE